MHDFQYQALGCYVAVDQLAVGLRAARTAELLQRARDRKLERKARRQQRRAARRGQEAYTTAV